jgi:DNA-binding transcriptional ArsR family regulator
MATNQQSRPHSDSHDVAELRDEYPTGWRILTQKDSVGLMLDAIMDSLPGSEFTKTELAERAGVSRQSVHTHLDMLLALGVLERVPETSPERYRADRESDVLELLHRLEGAVNERMNPAAE